VIPFGTQHQFPKIRSEPPGFAVIFIRKMVKLKLEKKWSKGTTQAKKSSLEIPQIPQVIAKMSFHPKYRARY
jgi:hypothetical protein